MSDRQEGFHVAIETSGRVGSIAVSGPVAGGRRILADLSFPEGSAHGREILPRLRDCCRKGGFRPADITLLIADVGPGSLTGVRVGLATVKALAFATGSHVIGTVSMDVMALRAAALAMEIACVIDARRGQVFATRYSIGKAGRPARVSDIELIEPATLASRLSPGTLLIGDAVERHASVFRDRGLVLAPRELAFPRAADALLIGEEAFQAGRRDDLHMLEPLYLRESVAESTSKRSPSPGENGWRDSGRR